MALLELTIHNSDRKMYVNPRQIVSITPPDATFEDQTQLYADVVLTNVKSPLRVTGSAFTIKTLAEKAGA